VEGPPVTAFCGLTPAKPAIRALSLFVCLTCVASYAAAQEVRFRWAFGAVTGSGAARHFAPITDEMTLYSGDELKLFISPGCPCFIYVLHQDQTGEFTVLFPAGGSFGDAPPPIGSMHYIPPAQAWLRLDEAGGTERVYLIASTTRLTPLERLLTANPSTPTQVAPAREIVVELARLQKDHTAHNWSERPVTMGGQVRGDRGVDSAHPDIARSATEITGSAPFFSRVFIIDHR